MRPWLIAGFLLVLITAFLWLGGDEAPPPGPRPSLDSLIDLDADGFAAFDPDWRLALPSDHGDHPGARSELWNLFGWLEDERGHRYAFQFNLTRLALTAQPPERASAWSAHRIYRGYLSLMAATDRTVHADERMSREALGLAGATQDPLAVWLADWSLTVPPDAGAGGGLRLAAPGHDLGLRLDLVPLKSAVTGRDLDLAVQDADDPGFHVYLLPRLRAQGTLTLDGAALKVQGWAWLDHAWGSLSTAQGQLALNRFAVQLQDGRDLMCIELRRRDGSGRPVPSCALIHADGRIQSFRRREIQLAATKDWLSPETGLRYPLVWRLAIPALTLELRLSPWIEDQELDQAGVWSGTVSAAGHEGGRELAGTGRIELSGLAGAP